MANLYQTQFTPHQNGGGAETEYDMNALAKRYNADTTLLTSGTGKKVIVRKRIAKLDSYRPILT